MHDRLDARASERALAGASRIPFWLDSPQAPQPAPPLEGHDECDLAVVGAGLTGVWAVLLVKERDPRREVVLLEADRIGWQASGRNGGLCMATLTHGITNGLNHFPGEMDRLERSAWRISTRSSARSPGTTSTVTGDAWA